MDERVDRHIDAAAGNAEHGHHRQRAGQAGRNQAQHQQSTGQAHAARWDQADFDFRGRETTGQHGADTDADAKDREREAGELIGQCKPALGIDQHVLAEQAGDGPEHDIDADGQL